MQHRHGAVGEADRIERERAAHRCFHHHRSVGCRRDVQQIHDPVDRGHGPLVQIGHIGQTRHRPQQALGQIHQRRITADPEFTLEYQ